MRRAASCILVALLAGCSAPCTSGAGVTPGAARSSAPPASAKPLDEAPPFEPERWSVLEDTLNARRTPKRNIIPYVALTDAEDQAYREWVRAAARAAEAGAEPPTVAPDGFVFERIFTITTAAPGSAGGAGSAGEVWLLAEHSDRRRGAAAILLRSGKARPLLVEAPHTFYDIGTLPLAVAVFEVQRARALIINTVHRKTSIEMAGGAAGGAARPRPPAGDDGDEPGDVSMASDFAHAPRSSFLSAHEELLGVFARALALQLHGFADRSAPGVQIIVSAAGTAADTTEPATALAALVGRDGVRRYPEQIHTLGGTTNVAARSSRAAGAPFLHFELARTLRDDLSHDLQKRGRFAVAVTRDLPRPK